MKPNNFPKKITLDGTEEIYSQTSGVSEKFSLEQAKEYIRPYKVYSALLSQKSANFPATLVLENSLGGDVTWEYVTTGTYRATFAGGVNSNNTLIFFGTPKDSTVKIVANIINENELRLETYDSSGLNDGLLLITSFEIRVYTLTEPVG